VPDSALLSILSSAGVAGVFCVLFVIGAIFPRSTVMDLKAENADLKAANDRLQEALGLERQRSNDVAQAGAVTNQLIGALTSLATEHRAAEQHEHRDAADKADAHARTTGPLDLAGKDVGL